MFTHVMKIVYDDGTWFTGRRTWTLRLRESFLTHHFIILTSSGIPVPDYPIGSRVAVAVTKPKYFEIIKI
jgi:hypothetical protein